MSTFSTIALTVVATWTFSALLYLVLFWSWSRQHVKPPSFTDRAAEQE